MVGFVLNAGVHGGIASCRVVGGHGGWRQAPTGLSFQNDANLTRSDIAKALASSVGETIETDVDTIGVNWSFDPLASAGSNLDTLGSWYMCDDGVTVLGTRPDLAEFVTNASDFEGMEGRATCEIEEYQADKLQPGALVSAASLENSIRVKHTRYLYSPKSFTVEVSAFEQKPLRLAEHAANKARFFGTYLYRVIEQISDRLELQAVDPVRGIPDQVLVTKAHGIPGVESTCTPSGEVLVVFANGDQGKPRVLAYLGAGTTYFGDDATADNLALAQPLVDLVVAAGPTILAAATTAGLLTPALIAAIGKYTTPLTVGLTKSGNVKASPLT